MAEVFGVSIDYLVGRSNELEKYYMLSKDDKDKVNKYIDELLNDKRK